MATPADLAFIQYHPLLTPGDRRAVLTLLAGPRVSPRRPLQHSIQGIKLQRGVTQGPRQIYRVFGSGDVDAPAEVAFEALSNLSLIPCWDSLFKGARYLTFARDQRDGGAAEAGRIHLVYGLPGALLPGVIPVSRLVLDRDFVLRAVRLFLPSGSCILCCRSISADEAADGDPKPSRDMIRGWMWSSGYVVVPTGGGSCCVNVSLQVDPKGWVPSTIVNLSLEAIPLNISRLRSTLAHMPAELAERLGSMNLAQARHAKPLEPPPPAGGAAETCSDSDSDSEAAGGGRGWQPARESWEDVCDTGGEEEAHKRARLAAA